MRALTLSFVAVFVAVSSFGAQSRDAVIDPTIATLMRVQTFDEVAIAPDGSRVAYVKTVRGANFEKTSESGVYVQALGSGSATRVTIKSDADPGSISWSPDSSQFAFSADQLYVAPRAGGNARALTNANGSFSATRWSPDGKSIAVLFIENASRKGGALEAMTPPSGDVDLQVEEQRIAIIDVASRRMTFATPANMYVYDFDWSPDSRSLVAETAFGSGEDNYWSAELYRFDVGGDPKGRSIYKPALQVANPRWSPDGKTIAFIEGLMSDEGSTGGDIYTIDANGGAATNLTPRMSASATTLEW